MDDDQDTQADEPQTELAGEKKGATVRHQIVEPTLFVTDAELIRRIGVPEKIAYAAIHMLDRNKDSGFPQKQALWGNRRYWPAVRQWFDRHHSVARMLE